jgi:hypothetical protein
LYSLYVTVDVATVLHYVSLKRKLFRIIVSIHDSRSNSGGLCDSSGYPKVRAAERRRWSPKLFKNRQSSGYDVAVDSTIFEVDGRGL